jgi:hypothetical protein
MFGNQYYLVGDATGALKKDNGANPVSNTWVHYAFVHEPTQTTFYRNGISQNVNATWPIPPSTTRTLNYIGNGYQNATGNPNAYITDFEIHNIALTAAQVLSIKNATSLA